MYFHYLNRFSINVLKNKKDVFSHLTKVLRWVCYKFIYKSELYCSSNTNDDLFAYLFVTGINEGFLCYINLKRCGNIFTHSRTHARVQ